MGSERWQQIERLYHAAMEREAGQRAAFVEQACAGDESLQQEVASLIAQAENIEGFIEQSAFEQVARSLAREGLGPGTKLGDYEVLGLVGSGAMGEVYRARDTRLGRHVAIKMLPMFLSADSDRLRRFEQEARAAAALNHPNILAVFQMGTREGAPYLVSELLEGETLRAQVKRGRLAVRRAIDYGVQITRGLGAAHEKGIVHRDLKPENLFVTKDGRVKILDFGLAKLTQQQAASHTSTPQAHTESGVVMGTVGYMAPEQVRGETADHRADIFAFGAILYEMLSGKRAFQKLTSAETMTAILNEDPPSISPVTANIPAALQRVVQRCLEKNPEQRFQSASDLAFALGEMAETSGDAERSPAKRDRKEQAAGLVAVPAPRLSVARWPRGVAIAILLAVLLVATTWWLARKFASGQREGGMQSAEAASVSQVGSLGKQPAASESGPSLQPSTPQRQGTSLSSSAPIIEGKLWVVSAAQAAPVTFPPPQATPDLTFRAHGIAYIGMAPDNCYTLEAFVAGCGTKAYELKFSGVANPNLGGAPAKPTTAMSGKWAIIIEFTGSVTLAEGTPISILHDDGVALKIDGQPVAGFNPYATPPLLESPPFAGHSGVHSFDLLYANTANPTGDIPTGGAWLLFFPALY
jgi:serine/threonine protein kinase